MIELLAPAGTYKALEAAVSAGADAVYFGGRLHNARMGGIGFSEDELKSAALFCALRNVKSYLTLNTLISDKEMSELKEFIEFINNTAITAVITQDLGLARLIKAMAPQLPLHASTQMTIHSLSGVKAARDLGFERVVISRELPMKDIKYICENSPVEIEAFVHGALCMSYSGQCYFSSIIAGRSGNRGMCGQPCRQLYKNGYELSLKDLAMACCLTDFIDCGIDALKIEGRLKSSEYVYGVVSVYRKLIDEKRDATPEEMEFLSDLFSRQGFTQAYFEGNPSKKMFGIRTEENKRKTAELKVVIPDTKRLRVHFDFEARKGLPLKLKATFNNRESVVFGDIPEAARNRATTAEECVERLSKTGGTQFEATVSSNIDDGLFIPVSALNNLRRELVRELEKVPVRDFYDREPEVPDIKPDSIKTHMIFRDSELAVKFEDRCDILWLPLFEIKRGGENYGAYLPSVITDSEEEQVIDRLREIKRLGISKVMCNNLGHVSLCLKEGFSVWGGWGLNLYNSSSLWVAMEMGISEATVSFENTIQQIRHMKKPLPVNAMIYGRLPLMTTENCIAKNAGKCTEKTGRIYNLTDIKNKNFPVLCEYPHRNVILNGIPLYMLDRKNEFLSCGISAFTLMFTTEGEAEISEIINAYKSGMPPSGPFTRGVYRRN